MSKKYTPIRLTERFRDKIEEYQVTAKLNSLQRSAEEVIQKGLDYANLEERLKKAESELEAFRASSLNGMPDFSSMAQGIEDRMMGKFKMQQLEKDFASIQNENSSLNGLVSELQEKISSFSWIEQAQQFLALLPDDVVNRFMGSGGNAANQQIKGIPENLSDEEKGFIALGMQMNQYFEENPEEGKAERTMLMEIIAHFADNKDSLYAIAEQLSFQNPYEQNQSAQPETQEAA